jgi:predicted DNA-binding protein (MmcQ/YjbR family)
MQMDATAIRKHCPSFPNATEKLQWEDELCFKVGRKIFAMPGLDAANVLQVYARNVRGTA